MEGERRAGPAITGLYLVLLISSILISYFIGKSQVFSNPLSSTPKVFGISDVDASDSFQVTDVSATTDSPLEYGCFYKQFNFGGKITTNGPGSVTYKWESSNNSFVSPIVLTFDSAGTKYVSTDWQVYGPGARWIKLHVYGPNDVTSSEVPFELKCN